MSKIFARTGNINPARSVFNLSHEKKFTCEMGQLIPALALEVVPGDILNLGNQIVIRMAPLVAPVMHEINCYVHYFYVPYRLLWDDWEDFITGGPAGDLEPTFPTWDPTSGPQNAEGSLWDYFGFPIDIVPTGMLPSAFLKYAYNLIYNEYYRDETLITEIDITANYDVLNRAWEKDYFTSSLPWQQRGTAPAFPLSGTTSAEWDTTTIQGGAPSGTVAVDNTTPDPTLYASTNVQARDNLLNALNTNTVDFSDAITFNVADLRLAAQIQRWLERNARAGSRYTEFLKAHFGVSPRDERLDRPEYIGGSKSPLIISEVLQTSETSATPQGTLAGHGINVDRAFAGKYRVSEYGIVLGLMSIMPRASYQQGINRMFLKETKYDFFFPEFANLSEQQVIRGELYVSDIESENNTLFGYQMRYAEMRQMPNIVCGAFRSSAAAPLDTWHLCRDFDSAPALNQTFIECDSVTGGAANPLKRIFAVPANPGFLVTFGNIIKAIRPLPVMAQPGYTDH